MCMSFYLCLCMWLYAYVYPCMCTYLCVLTAAITISNGFGEQRRPGRRCGHGPRRETAWCHLTHDYDNPPPCSVWGRICITKAATKRVSSDQPREKTHSCTWTVYTHVIKHLINLRLTRVA